MRYFRSTDSVYEQVRLALDAAWGHPSADGKTLTCIEPAVTAPHDADGQVLLAVQDEFCAYSTVVDMLPQLLSSGAVEEIGEATYLAAVQQAPSMTG